MVFFGLDNIIDAELREQIRKVQAFLEQEDCIVFAYLHGSSLRKSSPEDIDLAVFVEPKTFQRFFEEKTQTLELAIPLEMKLEEVSGHRIDLQLLNRAPLEFRYQVISNGLLLVDKDFSLRSEFEYLSIFPYLDFQHISREYFESLWADEKNRP